jgi:hypothetical protein
MARYQMPSEVNWSDPINLLAYPNSVTGGAILNWLAIGIYLIVAIGFWFGKKDFAGGMAVAGFATFSVMVWFWLGGVFGNISMGILIGITIIGFIALWIERKYE